MIYYGGKNLDDSSPLDLFGTALKEYFSGGKADLYIKVDNGVRLPYFVDFLFNDISGFTSLEKIVMDKCYGRVLDIGAGVGRFALELQNRGLEVCAIDISQQACEIMRKRGVKDVQCIDIFNFHKKNFDTVLLMGQGLGIAGNLSRFDLFLNTIVHLMNSTGQILAESVDYHKITSPDLLECIHHNEREARYSGEMLWQFEHNEKQGSIYEWLLIDKDSLLERTSALGLKCQIITEENEFYVAQISSLTKM